MIASDTFSVTHEDAQAIDDCWNRIGIHGDKSCPLLASTFTAATARCIRRRHAPAGSLCAAAG
jgi:hypothetical protein